MVSPATGLTLYIWSATHLGHFPGDLGFLAICWWLGSCRHVPFNISIFVEVRLFSAPKLNRVNP